MKVKNFPKGLVAATAAVIVLAGLPTAASATVAQAQSCYPPNLTNPVFPADDNWYSLLPGNGLDNVTGAAVFDGTGWTLRHGASIVAGPVVNPATEQVSSEPVLDLPSGSSAVSAPTCVSSTSPVFRTGMVNLAGLSGVSVSVAYIGANGLGPSMKMGTITVGDIGPIGSYGLPAPLAIPASTVSGWQEARLVFAANGPKSEYQLSNMTAGCGPNATVSGPICE